jgi:(R,R)-butanediol dehydrogenase/meso-butanediol dehydrogenase/diacetyl reductase
VRGIQALRWHGRHDVRLDEVNEPQRGDAGFALIEVAYCGICGSDLAEYTAGPVLIRPSPHPLSGQHPPLTLGHEFSGRVVDAADANGFEPGMRVTVDACWRCGSCEACQRGDYHLCRYGGSIGLHSDGAFAPLVRVPTYTLVPVPAEVSDQQAALTEPFAVGFHALERGGLRPGDDVVVFGFGPIGAASALVARAAGARTHVVEVSPARRARAGELGFPALDGGDEELPRTVRRAVRGGGADVVIESTGAAAVVPRAVECAKRGGRIVIVGLTKTHAQVDPSRLTLFERTMTGSLGYRHDLPRVAALMEQGTLDPSVIVDDVVPLSLAPQTFGALAERRGEKIKVLVDVHA